MIAIELSDVQALVYVVIAVGGGLSALALRAYTLGRKRGEFDSMGRRLSRLEERLAEDIKAGDAAHKDINRKIGELYDRIAELCESVAEIRGRLRNGSRP